MASNPSQEIPVGSVPTNHATLPTLTEVGSNEGRGRRGAVDDKYQDIEDWNADIDDTIPQRISNVANVIAVGGFHLVAIQEVRSGPKGYFAIRDLQRALWQNHRMKYRFFLSDYIGRGLVPEVMAFLYRPHKARYKPFDDARSIILRYLTGTS